MNPLSLHHCALRWKIVLFLLLSAHGLWPCAQALASEPARLPVTTLQAGMHLIHAEVADTESRRSQGLMQRHSLQPNHGMLFVFTESAAHCFWMHNTPLPLSIAFLDEDGAIVHLADMAPMTDTHHCPPRPIRFALEMTQGWFKQRGLGPGSILRHPQFFKKPTLPGPA